MKTELTELWALIVSYAKQETLDPLRRLSGFVKFGLIGSALLTIGYSLLSLTMLRVLQMETFPHFGGNLSWLPYVLTLAGSVILAFLLWRVITADLRRSARRANGSSSSSLSSTAASLPKEHESNGRVSA